jgi:hypothetical protein
MPFDKTKGYVPTSINEIQDSYKNNFNATFGASYTSQSFQGSGFWRVALPSILKDKEIDNALVDLLAYVNEKIKGISDALLTNQVGLLGGLKTALLSLKTIVRDVSVQTPMQNPEFEGKIAIAIDYVEGIDPQSESVQSAIADAIINNIGAGIHTDEQTSDVQTKGTLASTNQALDVFYKNSVAKNVYLKLSYKKHYGVALPSNEEIIETLLLNLKAYPFGGLFTPSLYVNLASFDYFRQATLSYAFENQTYNQEVFTDESTKGVNPIPLPISFEYQSAEITPLYYEKYVFSKQNIVIENSEVGL